MKKKKKKPVDLVRQWKKWTQREEDLLKELYPDMLNFELVEIFKRSESSISGKASAMGARKNWVKYTSARFHDHKHWSEKETEKLVKLFPILPIKQLLKRFQKRSRYGIISKAYSLGLKKQDLPPINRQSKYSTNLWRSEDKDLLAKLYPTTTSIQELAQLLGRTESAIRSQVNVLGLRKPCYKPGVRNGRNARYWTPKEDALIKRLYPTARTKDLAAQLNRNPDSVRSRANEIGIKKDRTKFSLSPHTWTSAEIRKLKSLWKQGHSKLEISKRLGIAVGMVATQINKQIQNSELQKRREKPVPWSKKEEKFLIQYYHKKPIEELVATLGKSKSAIQGKAGLLKITNTKWSDEEIEKLRQLWQKGHTKKEIAQKIGRTIRSVARQIARQQREFDLSKK